MHYDLKKQQNEELTRTLLKYMNPYCTEKCLKDINEGKLSCKCGETGIYEWNFKDDEATNAILTYKMEILFHPVYSSGTAALRGPTSFKKNMHYYWEMKMTSNLYGTDVMVGVGTKDTVIEEWRYRFLSLLGFDKFSWGYSYNGTIQHSGSSKDYGSKFGFGSLIGVHIDMYKGTIEFYLNRKPLGIAFSNLKSYELYPMICSTAAQSRMKLTCSVSMENSLQLLCMKCIVKRPDVLKQFRSIPGLARIYQRKFFWLIPKDKSRLLSKLGINENRSNHYPKRRKLSNANRWQSDPEYDQRLFMAINSSPNYIVRNYDLRNRRIINSNEEVASSSNKL